MEEAKNSAVQQLQTITACAKGMTQSTDVLFALDEPPPLVEELERVERARQTPQIVQLRQSISQCIQDMMNLWSGDATAADVRHFTITKPFTHLKQRTHLGHK